MNPIINALKSLSTTTVNIIVALVFFIVTAKITNFWKSSNYLTSRSNFCIFLMILKHSIVNRDVNYMYAKTKLTRHLFQQRV